MQLLEQVKSPSPMPSHHGPEPLNLYQLGMLFVVRCRYWSCRAGNDPLELDLTPQRIDAAALASFGTKDLLDPVPTRQRFQHLEKKARHVLERCSRPFPAANAHFVPWTHVSEVVAQLEALRDEFDQAVATFLAEYPALRASWQALHPAIPPGCYPSTADLSQRFGLTWSAFKVTGLPELTGVADVELELEERRVRDAQVRLMEDNLHRECRQFVEEYVLGFRREVGQFCDQVIAQEGRVHGRTLGAIRQRIDRFHAMNIFGDDEAAGRLQRLKQQIAGLTGQDLAEQPDVADRLNQACQALKAAVLDPDNVSRLTGRLKRRVVLE